MVFRKWMAARFGQQASRPTCAGNQGKNLGRKFTDQQRVYDIVQRALQERGVATVSKMTMSTWCAFEATIVLLYNLTQVASGHARADGPPDN